jgi:hypothetical protein
MPILLAVIRASRAQHNAQVALVNCSPDVAIVAGVFSEPNFAAASLILLSPAKSAGCLSSASLSNAGDSAFALLTVVVVGVIVATDCAVADIDDAVTDAGGAVDSDDGTADRVDSAGLADDGLAAADDGAAHLSATRPLGPGLATSETVAVVVVVLIVVKTVAVAVNVEVALALALTSPDCCGVGQGNHSLSLSRCICTDRARPRSLSSRRR